MRARSLRRVWWLAGRLDYYAFVPAVVLGKTAGGLVRIRCFAREPYSGALSSVVRCVSEARLRGRARRIAHVDGP